MKLENLGDAAVSSAVFAGIGLAVFAIAFWIMTKIAPFSVKKEIEEDQNVALAVIMAGVLIGISLIIASAIHSRPDSRERVVPQRVRRRDLRPRVRAARRYVGQLLARRLGHA